jgi:peptidoglycan/LPS O-acetylase OafA/YrhL|tara:strand:+ start:1616 stop:2620 length:1005 start_codon:yes stop_codon:yes gene_type:complete
MKQRIKELDGLRGIAAISVVLFHYFFRYNQIYTHENISSNLFSYSKYGIGLFFIISGFVILWSLSNIKKPLDFIVSRFSRLYPVYWAAISFTFLFVSLIGLPGREVTITTFFGNFLMFHNYFNIPHVDGVYWTLSIELTFYLWMLIIFSLKLLKRIDFISLFTLIISALFHFKVITLSDIMIDLLFIRWSVFFIIGISLYKIFVKETNLLTYINIIVALALIFHIFELKSLIICSSITLVIYLGTNGYLGFLKNHVLTFTGTISYSLYLIHQNIGYVIINKGYEYDIHPLVSILSSIVFSIIIAVILNKLVEKPASKFLKNIYQKRNANNVYKE